MIHCQHRRGWVLIAVIAIGLALLFLLVPHTHSHGGRAWLALVPVFFVETISPLSLLSPLAYIYIGRAPEAPVLPTSFQRPPPPRLA